MCELYVKNQKIVLTFGKNGYTLLAVTKKEC